MAEILSLFPALSGMTSLPEIVWEDDPTTTKRMEYFLNCALCIIHNLSKTKKHREKFRTPEMRRTLGIYKGSPSSERRSYCMLAISHMADPAIDMSLLEDKYGAINDLTDFLDKSLVEGDSTGFSVQELVEGLAQLAVHPINKEKIIDKSLSSFYKILEKSNEKKLTRYVRDVLDGFGFSDVCPTGNEQCLGDTEKQNKGDSHPDEQNESADIMLMLDDLQCVLLERQRFSTNDVMDIISGVKQIVYGNLNCRQTIFKHMTKQEWPDLFVRIISDVWALGKDVGLYTDEVSWSILEDAISMLTTYSDADVDCADALIEHGALLLVHQIADVYFDHLLQKATVLQEKVAEYRGETIQGSKQPGENEHQSEMTTHTEDDLLKHQTTEDSVGDSSHGDKPDPGSTPTSSLENETKREFTGSRVFYTLKPVSQFACVNDDSTIAYRKDSDSISNRAVFVSNEPIESLKLFELNIEKIAVQEMYSLELGVCMFNEFPDGTFYAGRKFGQGRGFWFLSENKLWKDFASIGGGYKLNLCNIRVNDRVGFVKYPDGTMGFLYNGQYQGIAFRNIPEGVYGLVATTGKCVQVSISDNSGTSIQEETSVNTLKEPLESFSVRTADGKLVSFSRMRKPYGLDFVDEEKHKEMKNMYQERDDTNRKEYMESENRFNPIANARLQTSNDGYTNESNMRTLIRFVFNLYNIHRNPVTRVDTISKVPIQGITLYVKIYSDMLKSHQRNNPPPEATNILPNRLRQIFDVVRPCFDNIQDMSGIVWTGSTSEGFAIPDNSGPDTPYIDEEMDLMIPLAVATEGSQKGPSDKVTMQSCKANEKENFKRECVVTELENIGKRQLSKEYPTFIWIPSSNAGYVFINIPESMQSCISEGFTRHVCARLPENSNLFLTRSKLLAIQEEYTRGRLSAVQSNITTSDRNNVDGQFQGQLKLVQEGPVQTISVHYQSQEIGGSVLEFDQTVDVAIALKGVDWPTIANPWISRERHWPEKTIVDKIVKDGYHIVPKYHPGGTGIDLEWRLSFSVAERTLAHTFTDNQRKCYMVFKKLWRTYLKVPKVVSSYHIKTTMFWLCERTSSSQWKESDMGDRYLDLQNFLIFFLQRSNVPNFFIPENNMLSNVDPANVDVVLAKAQDIRRHQHEHHKNLVTPTSSFVFT